MKKDIHPEFKEIDITCVCGTVWKTRSTATKLARVDICSACHPFYSGKQKVMDTEGRIEKFKKRYANVTVGASKDKK